MADKYLLEDGSGGYTLEDGSGVLLLDATVLGSSLTDNFDDNSRDTAKWNTGTNIYGAGITAAGTVSEANGRLEVTPSGGSTTNHNGYVSVDTFDLTSDAIYVNVQSSTGTVPANQQFAVVVGVDASNTYMILNDSGTMFLFKQVAGSYTNYGSSFAHSFTTHRWLRLRFSGGSVFLDTAPDTASNPPVSGDWTNRISGATDAGVPTTALKLSLDSGNYAAVTPATIYFDGFNTATAGATGYTLSAASGSFALSGTAANLKRALVLSAASGSYSLTGTAATLKRGLKLTAAAGAFSLTGTAANFPLTRKLTAAAGAFTLSGTAASLKRGLKVTAASGAFALTGTAATLTKTSVNNYTLTAASGSFALSGTAATLKRGLKLSAAPGSYALSGTAANLKRGLKLSAASGSYVLTGTAATLTKSTPNPVMTALPAAFVITGSASTRRLNSAGGGGSIAFFLS